MMVGALDGFVDGLVGGPRYQTQGGIVKRVRGWFWRTAFYRENDARVYERMPNGELRRKDMEAWRARQRELGLPDTRAVYQAIRVGGRKFSNRERGKEQRCASAWQKMCQGGILARTTRAGQPCRQYRAR